MPERNEKAIFRVDGQKAEKAREPTVENLVRGIWRLSGEYARVYTIENSNRDKTEQCA